MADNGAYLDKRRKKRPTTSQLADINFAYYSKNKVKFSVHEQKLFSTFRKTESRPGGAAETAESGTRKYMPLYWRVTYLSRLQTLI